VLALQGDFHAHARAFRRVGVTPLEVRRVQALDALDLLVIPGGESTTLLNLMRDEPWFDALRAFHARGGWLFGTCAGAILLSREVRAPSQVSLGLLDAVIARNAYGRQVDSFETRLDVAGIDGEGEPLHVAFIRAPRFLAVGAEADVLARLGDEPVLVRQGRVLAATFHPEITGDDRLHAWVVALARTREPAAPPH
jgi:5'-phosphate synthase pdxT subunit